MSEMRALVVDDDEGFRTSLAELVAREGFSVSEAPSIAEARASLAQRDAQVLLVDLGLPDGHGLELLRDETISAGRDFIIITGNASLDSALEAMREGALDYLPKPVDRTRLKSILAHVVRTRELKYDVHSLREELRELGRFGKLVGRSAPMQAVYDLIERVAPSQANVLITGESGTGKELVASTIHELSKRRSGPFLPVNAGAVSKSVIESELFGHEKGSFTGAERNRRGYFEEASAGTLFLDEVTEMPMDLQVKLLRVLETGSVLRVGASEPLRVNTRVLAATNRDPEKAVRDGLLREDLYYRLSVFPIRMPPLRDHLEDVELLADHFLDEANERDGTRKRWTAAARAKLKTYGWPGNVRELKNVVERAAILADTEIGEELVPGGREAAPAAAQSPSLLQVRVGSTLEDAERRLILATLQDCGGDKRRAAEVLGISVKTLYNRLNVYDAMAAPLPGEADLPGPSA